MLFICKTKENIFTTIQLFTVRGVRVYNLVTPAGDERDRKYLCIQARETFLTYFLYFHLTYYEKNKKANNVACSLDNGFKY